MGEALIPLGSTEKLSNMRRHAGIAPAHRLLDRRAICPLAGKAAGRMENRPIALLVNDLSSGGAQRRIVTLANRFVELGRSVDLVTVDPNGPIGALLSPAVKLVVLVPNGALPRISPAIYARKLVEYLDEAKPSVLMSAVAGVHLLAVVASAKHDRRVSLVLRASRHPYRAIRRFKALNRALESIKLRRTAWRYAQADAIVALSAGTAKGVRRLLGNSSSRIETIHNPVIESTLLDSGGELYCRAKNPVTTVLGVGRLVHQKNFETLVRAFAILRAQRPARLVLLGEGKRRGHLQRLARRLGIADDVEMPGEVSNVTDWLRHADLLVSSSLWEGLQATLIEALAVGCPVVATDCPGGARDTLENGRIGALVPICDPQRMASAMCDQLDHPPDPRRLAESAARFTFAGKAEAYIALFDSLAKPEATSGVDRAARPSVTPRASA